MVPPMAETSAMALPETPPNSVDPTTVTCPRPPRTCPTTDEASAIIRSDSPPFIISSPVKMNRGIARSETDVMSEPICWKTTIDGTDRYRTVARVAASREKATGTPIASSTANRPNRIRNSMFRAPVRFEAGHRRRSATARSRTAGSGLRRRTARRISGQRAGVRRPWRQTSRPASAYRQRASAPRP